VHQVGFIIKKFVTMHDHMKVKCANKNAGRKHRLEAAEECVMTALCTCALIWNESILKFT